MCPTQCSRFLLLICPTWTQTLPNPKPTRHILPFCIGTIWCLSTRAFSSPRITLRSTMQLIYSIVVRVSSPPLTHLKSFCVRMCACLQTQSLLFVLFAARRYWCFGFEAKNQEVKAAAEVSNNKSTIKSAATTLSLQAARRLKKRKRSEVVTGIQL